MDSSLAARRGTKARLRLEAKTLQNKLMAIDEEKKKSLLKLSCETLNVKHDFGTFRRISPRISPSSSLENLKTEGALLVERPPFDRRAARLSGIKTSHKRDQDTVLPEMKRRGSSVIPILRNDRGGSFSTNEDTVKSRRSFSLPLGRSKSFNSLAPNLKLTTFRHNSGLSRERRLITLESMSSMTDVQNPSDVLTTESLILNSNRNYSSSVSEANHYLGKMFRPNISRQLSQPLSTGNLSSKDFNKELAKNSSQEESSSKKDKNRSISPRLLKQKKDKDLQGRVAKFLKSISENKLNFH